MCGIAGRLNFDNRSIAFTESARMIRLLKHRGPDSQNLLFIDRHSGNDKAFSGLDIPAGSYGDMFLGHARLAIIDLATGNQPMADSTGRYVIVFNGEIYNYIEIRKLLLTAGFKFNTTSDTEVILNAYKAYGQDCLKHLNGMFAFVIYDKIGQTIFCARDRLGIKPFYYYYDNHKFIFASEIKSILCQSDVGTEIDYHGIADYLTFQYTIGNKTLFKKISSLAPGYSATLGKNGLLFNRYWKPDLEPDYSMKEDDAINGLRILLDNAIDLQMRSDVQIGAHLSGGLDSSVISGIMSKKYEKTLFTFTGKFNEGMLYDESSYAMAMAEKISAKSFFITPTANDLINYFPSLVWHMDYPVAGPGSFPQFMVSKIAGKMLKVVMGGQGGDEIFMGYPRYIRSIIENKLLFGHTDRCLKGDNAAKLVFVYIQKYGLPGIAGWAAKRRLNSFDRRYIITSAPLYGLGNIFVDELAATLKNYSPFEEALGVLGSIESSSLINRMSWYDINNYLAGLLQVEDRTSMAWSLESRVPLLDHRIVEFCLKMPSDIKLKNLESKHILKKVAEPELPEIIRNRKDKRGFPTPTDIWFNGILSDYANSFVTPQILTRRGLFNPKKLAEYFISGKTRYTPAIRRETLLWAFINLELWFQLFIDRSNNVSQNPQFTHQAVANRMIPKPVTHSIKH